MKLNAIIVLVSILLTACTRNSKRPEIAKKQMIDTVIKTNGIQDTALYLRVGNPDTALAIAMFKDCYNYDYNLQREEYIRWDLEKLKIRPLFDSLFGKKEEYEAYLKQIVINEHRFLQDARNVVASDAKQYHGISDTMEFAYLLDKRDTSLKRMIKMLLWDSPVDSTEKVTLENALSKW